MGLKVPNLGEMATQAMGAKAGEAMKKLADEFELIEKDLVAVIDSNNEIKLGLISIYELLKEMALKQGLEAIDIPKPHIDMKLEE